MKKLSDIVTVTLSLIIVIMVGIYPPSNSISWDVFGYYLYLPAVFIYNDLGLENVAVIESIIQTYNNTGTFYQATKLPEGNWVLKYPMGMAVLYAPFFFISHLFALFSNYPADGFSTPYQWGLTIGSLIYTLIGLYFLRKILLKFFNDKITAVVIVLIVIGTNYYHIVVYNATMPHNYLFTLYTLIIWFTIKWHETFKLKYILLLGLACGLSILSRPSEVVCLLIPALWTVSNKENWLKKIKLIWKKRIQIISFLCLVVLIGLPQLIYFKIYAGKFLFMSYSNYGEGMEFLSPYTLKVLFSFRKGWLIYTPIMVFAIIGVFIMLKKQWKNSFAILIFTVLNVYIVSSWSCWWYADSFSQRALVQSYALLSLPLGYFIHWVYNQKLNLQIVSGVLFTLLIILNLFQIWQINNLIIHPSRMTFPYYVSVIGKTTVKEEDKKLLLVNRSVNEAETFENQKEFSKKTLDFVDFEKNKKYILNYEEDQKYELNSEVFFSGLSSLKLDSNTIISPKFERKYEDLTNKEYAWIRVSVMIYPVSDLKTDPASLVVTFRHKWNNYKYSALNFEKLQNIELNKWNKVTFDYLTPEPRKESDNISVYVWNRGKQNLYIDDLKIDIFEPKN